MTYSGLALILEDYAIDWNLWIKSKEDYDECKNGIVTDSEETLRNTVPELVHDSIETFIQEYRSKVFEFMDTSWYEPASIYDPHIAWLENIVEKYSVKNNFRLNVFIQEGNMPFGNILPYEIQELIVSMNIEPYQNLEKYVKLHILPVIDYMKQQKKYRSGEESSVVLLQEDE